MSNHPSLQNRELHECGKVVIEQILHTKPTSLVENPSVIHAIKSNNLKKYAINLIYIYLYFNSLKRWLPVFRITIC